MIPSAQSTDAAARERIRTSLDESLIVEASAGTGKTTELIRRIVAVLAAGTPVQEIAAVTFTHKAAGELKIRLRQELDRARANCADATQRGNLEDALERLEEAAIGTIHGFCAQILRERPVEAQIDPAFEELTEPEAARLRDRAFDTWFQRQLKDGAPALRRALARLAWRDARQAETSPLEVLKYAGRQLIEWRDHTTPWRAAVFDRANRIEALLTQCNSLAAILKQCTRQGDTLVEAMGAMRELLIWVARSATGGQRDDDTIEARLLHMQRELKRRQSRKGSGVFAPGISRQDVLDARDALIASIESFRIDSGADFAAALRREMQSLLAEYEDRKKRAGKLDFLDLLLLVRNLVRGNREVREYLQRRFSRIFVDEFQDTDPLQAEILILLAAGDSATDDWLQVTPAAGKLFVVGDPKQSIYKFRRADVVLYERVCRALESRGVARIRLTQSFRAARPIQQLVNAAFEPEMTGNRECGQALYAPLEEHTPPYDEQPAIVVLPPPKPYGSVRVSNESINACLPDTIGAYIDWLVNASGWKVRDAGGDRVPMRYRDICVLFRRMTNYGNDLSRDYTQALEARGIPHLLVGSKSFFHREEVETVRAALAAIEWPDDELSVFATLHGSLFAIPDHLLLRFRFEVSHLHPFHPLPGDLAGEFAPIAEALRLLADLHRQRNRAPIAGTVNALLEYTRAHAGFALRRTGAQALANVYRICDLARTFELTGGLSFRGFIDELAALAEKSESTEAPVLEEASDGVRLMTVHSAKGLEFPVVILADMTANLASLLPERHVDGSLCAMRLLFAAPWELIENETREHDREIAEGVRVAYVASTRARDLLIIPAVGDTERDGWLSPLNKAIYPPRDKRREAVTAPGVPAFKGKYTVLEASSKYPQAVEDSVHPGSHTPQSGDHQVTWWDPSALQLNVTPSYGLRQEDILSPEPAARAEEGIARFREWQNTRRQTGASGSRPSIQITLPTDNEEPPERGSVQTVSVTPEALRPKGPRFGTLLHAILRDLDLHGDTSQIGALAKVHSRLLHAPPEEQAAAVASVTTAWQHSLLNRARAAVVVTVNCHCTYVWTTADSWRE